MTRISRTARIPKPQQDVIARLEAFFSRRPKLHVRALGFLRAEVDVRYSLLYDWTSVGPPRGGIAFAWKPAWRGFPSFGATLTVRPDGEDTDLVLDGSYEPPAGVVGQLFDRLAGRRLANRTMDSLLDRLASIAQQ